MLHLRKHRRKGSSLPVHVHLSRVNNVYILFSSNRCICWYSKILSNMVKSIDIATCFLGFKLWLLIQNQARYHIYKNDEGTLLTGSLWD